MTESKSDARAELILEYDSLGTAQAVQGFLESEGVGSFLDVVRTTAGVPSRTRLTVPADLAHRARALLSDSEFSDRELTFLATGELDPEPE